MSYIIQFPLLTFIFSKGCVLKLLVLTMICADCCGKCEFNGIYEALPIHYSFQDSAYK